VGSIRRRAETGHLYFDFHFQGQRCREYSALADTGDNRRKMEIVIKKIEADIASNRFDYATYFPDSPRASKFSITRAGAAYGPQAGAVLPARSLVPTFKEFVELWAKEKEADWRFKTKQGRRRILQTHLLPAFGHIRIDEIDRTKVCAFRAELATPGKKSDGSEFRRGNTTINAVIGLLRQILDEAAARYQTINPCLTIKRLKKQRTDVQPFNLEEVRRIIECVRADFQDYLTVRFFTGMRTGEVHGLKWKNVDFERKEILIRETFSDGRTDYTKNDSSQREIFMSEPVRISLLRQKNVSAPISEYVFCSRDGAPIDSQNFNSRIWKPLLEDLGFKHRRAYEMRHTCATLWLGSGENTEWIARQLGHTTTEMLFRVYSRYVPNNTRRDGSAFDRMISSGITATTGAIPQLLPS